MSRRKDISSSVHVTIMDRAASTASPSSYSKTFPALGAGAAVTRAASLGGERFVDLIEPYACVSALVLQHGSKCTPARVQDRLALSGLRKAGGIHVAYEDGTATLDEGGAAFVQEVLPAIGDLGVDRLDTIPVARALCGGQVRLQVAVEALRFDGRDVLIAEGGKRLQAQIAKTLPESSLQKLKTVLTSRARLFNQDACLSLMRKRRTRTALIEVLSITTVYAKIAINAKECGNRGVRSTPRYPSPA
jgi:hypothetical protein